MYVYVTLIRVKGIIFASADSVMTQDSLRRAMAKGPLSTQGFSKARLHQQLGCNNQVPSMASYSTSDTNQVKHTLYKLFKGRRQRSNPSTRLLQKAYGHTFSYRAEQKVSPFSNGCIIQDLKTWTQLERQKIIIKRRNKKHKREFGNFVIAVVDFSLDSRFFFNKGEWTSDYGMGWDYASTLLSI